MKHLVIECVEVGVEDYRVSINRIDDGHIQKGEYIKVDELFTTSQLGDMILDLVYDTRQHAQKT